MIKYIRRWNIWRKRNTNSVFHKFLVLLGIIKSPTMMFISLPEEWQKNRGGVKVCRIC